MTGARAILPGWLPAQKPKVVESSAPHGETHCVE